MKKENMLSNPPEFHDCFSKGNALEETIEALVSSLVKDKSGNSLNVMKINDKTPLAPPYIRTPNLETDIQDLFFPDLSIEEFKTIYKHKDPDKKLEKKLRLVTERFEFIKHLLALKELLEQNKKPKSLTIDIENGFYSITDDITFHGREYNGVDYNIEALCFYLLLTCIDTIANEKPPDFKEWLINKIDTSQGKADCSKYIESKHKEYLEKYGLNNNFKKAVKEISNSEKLRPRVISHFAFVKLDNGNFSDEIIAEWNKKPPEDRIDDFADYLSKVRNNFTHQSLESYIPRIPAKKLIVDTNKKIPLSLVPLETDSLLKLIEDIVIELVKKQIIAKRNKIYE